MSDIKENAKKLREQAKKYGYEIKHTHALELVSQVLEGKNRHVALKEEGVKDEFCLEEETNNLFYGYGPTSFRLDRFEKALKVPFFESYVLMIGEKHSEEFDIVVLNELGDLSDIIGEVMESLEWIQVLSPEDLTKKIRYSNEDQDEGDIHDEGKPILEWILDKHKRTGKMAFSVFHDNDLDDSE